MHSAINKAHLILAFRGQGVVLCGFFCLYGAIWAQNGEGPQGLLAGPVALQSEVPTYLTDFGSIISEVRDSIKTAIVEKIILRPRLNDTATATLERNAILVRYPGAKGTVVMCHGFMCNKHDQAFLRMLFKGYNTLSFDFRAHGDNRGGQVSTLGQDEAQEVIAAAQFIKRHPVVNALPVYVYGFSMGAVAAIEAQARNSSLFSAMILDCPFESSENVLKRVLAYLKLNVFGYTFEFPGKSLLGRYAFHPHVQALVRTLLKVIANIDPRDISMRVQPFFPAMSAKKITVPVLFIHCKNDRKVSIEAIKELFTNTASDYKLLRLTNGRGHFDSYFYSPERYALWVEEFLYAISHSPNKRQEIIEDLDE